MNRISKITSYKVYVFLIIILADFANQFDFYITSVAEIPFIDYGSYEYGLLAGPMFIGIFTCSGVLFGFFCLVQNRVKFAVFGMFLWGLMIGLVCLCTKFWQVAFLRVGLGLTESNFNPIATSLLCDIFPEQMHGVVMGFFNIGNYAGYGLSFGIGDFINSWVGWRLTYFITGMKTLMIAIIFLVTVKEPDSKQLINHQLVQGQSGGETSLFCPWRIFNFWMINPSLFLLSIAAGVRSAGWYCWTAYTEVFFSELFKEMPLQTKTCEKSFNFSYLGHQVCNSNFPYCMNGSCSSLAQHPWHDVGLDREKFDVFISITPMVAGSLGAIVGGAVSDRFSQGKPISYRLVIVTLSCLGAAPFCAGVLLAPYPWCFACLFAAYAVGEMWIGVLLAVMIDLVPKAFTSVSVAIYLFIRINISGNAPLLVPFLKKMYDVKHTYTFYASPLSGGNESGEALQLFEVTQIGSQGLKTCLLWLFPGVYILSALLFFIAYFFVKETSETNCNQKSKEYAPLKPVCIELQGIDNRFHENLMYGSSSTCCVQLNDDIITEL